MKHVFVFVATLSALVTLLTGIWRFWYKRNNDYDFAAFATLSTVICIVIGFIIACAIWTATA